MRERGRGRGEGGRGDGFMGLSNCKVHHVPVVHERNGDGTKALFWGMEGLIGIELSPTTAHSSLPHKAHSPISITLFTFNPRA